MHFVVDSITSDIKEYFTMLNKALASVGEEKYILISSLIDSTFWSDGDRTFPSPNITHDTIKKHIVEKDFEILFEDTMHAKSPTGLDGGFSVLLAVKNA